MHPDKNLATTGHGIRNIAELKDVARGAVTLVPDCFHPLPP
jgi:hypothetical protein